MIFGHKPTWNFKIKSLVLSCCLGVVVVVCLFAFVFCFVFLSLNCCMDETYFAKTIVPLTTEINMVHAMKKYRNLYIPRI